MTQYDSAATTSSIFFCAVFIVASSGCKFKKRYEIALEFYHITFRTDCEGKITPGRLLHQVVRYNPYNGMRRNASWLFLCWSFIAVYAYDDCGSSRDSPSCFVYINCEIPCQFYDRRSLRCTNSIDKFLFYCFVSKKKDFVSFHFWLHVCIDLLNTKAHTFQ